MVFDFWFIDYYSWLLAGGYWRPFFFPSFARGWSGLWVSFLFCFFFVLGYPNYLTLPTLEVLFFFCSVLMFVAIW